MGVSATEVEPIIHEYKNHRELTGYRVRGVEKVQALCENFIAVILSDDSLPNIPAKDILLARARKTLEAIKRHQIKAEKKSFAENSRYPIVTRYLSLRYPLATEEEIHSIVSSLNESSGLSLEEFSFYVRVRMGGRPHAWAKAQKDFVKSTIDAIYEKLTTYEKRS